MKRQTREWGTPGRLPRCKYTHQVWQMSVGKRSYLRPASTTAHLIGLAGNAGVAVLTGAEAAVKDPKSFVYVQRWDNARPEQPPQGVWDSVRGHVTTDLHRDIAKVLRGG